LIKRVLIEYQFGISCPMIVSLYLLVGTR